MTVRDSTPGETFPRKLLLRIPDCILVPRVTYNVTMDGGEPESYTLFRPEPMKVLSAWAMEHGYKLRDCKMDALIHFSSFSWTYEPHTGGFFSEREKHYCTAERVDELAYNSREHPENNQKSSSNGASKEKKCNPVNRWEALKPDRGMRRSASPGPVIRCTGASRPPSHEPETVPVDVVPPGTFVVDRDR